MKTTFPSITSINKWSGTTVSFIDDIPYVWKDGMFHYFTQGTDKNFRLTMTSTFDLMEQKS